MLVTRQCWWPLHIGDPKLVEKFLFWCRVTIKMWCWWQNKSCTKILQLSTTNLVQHSWPIFILHRFWFHLLMHLIATDCMLKQNLMYHVYRFFIQRSLEPFLTGLDKNKILNPAAFPPLLHSPFYYRHVPSSSNKHFIGRCNLKYFWGLWDYKSELKWLKTEWSEMFGKQNERLEEFYFRRFKI